MIPYLKEGDLIEILAPAKAIEPERVFYAREQLEANGFRVRISENCLGSYHYFSGTAEERYTDFQKALDDQEVRAVLCARGGYGSIQILDRINWSGFQKSPKWIIGFSDVTVFHQKLAAMGLPSIHATMPLNFRENSPESLDSLTDTLKGGLPNQTFLPEVENLSGDAQGILIGGNLSIIYSLLGTSAQPDFTNTILFIEDLSEQLYHLDRIFYSLKLSGVLGQISGMVVGGMTDMKDTEVPFGKGYRELIRDHLSDLDVPLCFNFPAGHINDNRALVFGKEAILSVSENDVSLRYL